MNELQRATTNLSSQVEFFICERDTFTNEFKSKIDELEVTLIHLSFQIKNFLNNSSINFKIKHLNLKAY